MKLIVNIIAHSLFIKALILFYYFNVNIMNMNPISIPDAIHIHLIMWPIFVHTIQGIQLLRVHNYLEVFNAVLFFYVTRVLMVKNIIYHTNNYYLCPLQILLQVYLVLFLVYIINFMLE